MKFKGLDGRMHALSMIHNNNTMRVCSAGHDRARKVIEALYKMENIWEEVSLPGTKPVLYADFLLPNSKVMVEVHGKQHYEYTPYFHKSKKEFVESKKRDNMKKEWCRINEIRYIELPDTEDNDEWIARIIG